MWMELYLGYQSYERPKLEWDGQTSLDRHHRCELTFGDDGQDLFSIVNSYTFLIFAHIPVVFLQQPLLAFGFILSKYVEKTEYQMVVAFFQISKYGMKF